jgi:carbohydrate kinase (thermoresistant glucokinase family)
MFVVVMGVSGSGKSTIAEGLADLLDVMVIDADDLHPPANVAKMAAGQPLTDEDRWPWLDDVGRQAAALLDGAGGVVVACSALRRSYRDVLRLHGATRFIHLHGDASTIQGRMMAREGHFMDASLLDSQLATLEPTDAETDVAAFDVANPPRDLVFEALRWLQASL